MGRPALIGKTLGEFVIRERIGEGGSATVYRADQPSLGREVVLKVLRGGRRVSGDAVARFLREAKLASRFEHPFAAHVYAFGAEPDGVLWLAMELVRGTPLDRILDAQGPMPLARLAALLDRLCEVVAAAHEQGIVHRDIKPANVMVVSGGGRLHPKLLDFGVAKLGADPEDTDERADSDDDMVGSPLYMAPEQWSAPQTVDRRADVYALAVLAYEALTGERPFAAATLHEIARAHATRPAPRVPPTLPSALDDVLARALAKRPGDRFDGALELAAAFRRAAGLDDAIATVTIDAGLRDRVLARAPQPIAEAVGALEAARNPHQARAALFDVVRAIARWVGACALAGARRLGSGRVDGGHLLLRKDRFDDGDWLRVVRALVAPLADRPAVHPVPELVELFAAGGAAVAPWEALIALREEDEHAPRVDVARTADVVARGVAQVSALLAALAPLFDYDVVVARGGLAERWSGVRRMPRLLAGTSRLDEDRPALFDRDGAQVLSLWPFVQALAPAPGLAPELFVVDGRAGSAGARLIAAPAGFEHGDEEAWRALRLAIAGPDEAEPEGAAAERAPYRGLAAFTRDDAAFYVGRERDVEAFVNRLRVTPLLVVVGPSGAGKSSFVQAGVVPAMDGWRAVVARPGRAPLASLEARLARDLDLSLEGLGPRLRAGPPTLVIVDQLEELFTLCPSADERAGFASLLMELARTADDPVRVVLCLRDDFLIRAHELAPLRELLATSLHLLGAPAADDLVRMVEEPARRAGYDFDDPSLVREMVADVEGRPGALPLLSFTATRLWERRDRQLKILPRAACDALGGVSGALAQHAEDTLAAMPNDARALVREAFRHLVTAEGTRAVLSRAELVQLLANSTGQSPAPPAKPVGSPPHTAAASQSLGGRSPGAAESMIEQLVAARLLTAGEGERDGERIEIVHEALIGAWPRLVGWRQEDTSGARLRDQLRAAARQWHERGRPRGLLWRDEALLELELWRARSGGALTQVEEEFAHTSASDAARGRRWRRGLAALAASVLVAGSIVILVESRQTERERERAEQALDLAQEHATTSHERTLELLTEQGRLALVDGDPLRAAAYLAEAFRQGGGGAILRFLSARASDALSPPPVRLAHAERVGFVAWSPDGARLVTTSVDGAAILWDAAGNQIATLGVTKGEMSTGVFAPDGSMIAIAGAVDGVVRMYDTRTGRAVGTLVNGTIDALAPGAPDSFRAGPAPARARVHGLAFEPDGRRVVTCADDGVRIWDGPDRSHALNGPPGPARACAWSPDGSTIAATGGARDTAWLAAWDAATGARRFELISPGASALAYAPDGKTIAFASGPRARLIDARTGAIRAELVGHGGNVVDVAFAPDGARVATASRDDTARLWDVATGVLARTLRGHRDAVTSVSFSADGARVLTTSDDGVARIWDARGGTPVRALHGHTALVPRGAFAPDGMHVATAGWDRAALIWTVRTGWDVAVASDAPLDMATIADDGAVIAGGGNRVERYDPVTGARLASLDVGGPEFSWSRDGKHVAAVIDGVVVMRDLPGGAERARFGRGISSVWLRADGGEAITVDNDGVLAAWNADGSARPSPAPVAGGGHMISGRVTDDGRYLLGYHDRVVEVWDGTTGAHLHTLAGHDGHVYDLWPCPGHAIAASVSNDRTARVWDVAKGTAIATLVGHTNVTLEVDFTPDCARAITASSDGTAKIWEVATGRVLASLDVLVDGVTTAHLSLDGRRAVTTDRAGRVRVWNLADDARAPADIVAWARCHLPFRVDAGRLEATAPDPSACR